MLPAADDGVLLKELRVVLTAGFQLPRLHQNEAKLPNCLYLARTTPSEAFGTTAKHFLTMLNDSLIGNSEARDSGTPLLTLDESIGLRILFGTHPDYYESQPMSRRENAAEYLVARVSEEPVKPDTFYRSHESSWLQTVIVCLRSSYGQESGQPDFQYQVVSRHSVALVGKNRRISEVRAINSARALVDGLDFLRVFIHLPDPEYLEDFHVEPLGDLLGPDIDRESDSVFRLTFTPANPIAFGEVINWGYARRYRYRSGTPPLQEDRLTVSAKNGGFSITLEVNFEAEPPPTIWHFQGSRNRIPGEPTSEVLLTPNAHDGVSLTVDRNVQARWAYGVAWRW